MSADPSPQTRHTQIYVRGEHLVPLAEGGLWWPQQNTLIVSDLHLEKGSSYARAGQLLPPYDTSATLHLVERLVHALKPERVISLGDSFHEPAAEHRLTQTDIGRIKALTSATDWIWVEGNHDPDPPAHLGGRAAKVLRQKSLIFRHEPTGELGEIAGHLHPCARIKSKVRTMRRRCFITDGNRLILPAMGAFTGGLNVLDAAFHACFPEGGHLIFALSKHAVFPVSLKRLIPENLSPAWRATALEAGAAKL